MDHKFEIEKKLVHKLHKYIIKKNYSLVKAVSFSLGLLGVQVPFFYLVKKVGVLTIPPFPP